MNQLNLYTGNGVVQSQRAIARRMDTEVQLVQARAEIAHAQSQAGATLAAAAINNISALVSLGEQVVKTSPAAAGYVGLVIQGYSSAAAMQVTAFMR